VTWGKLLPLAVVAALMLLRLRRATREQPLRIGRLWVVPALVTLGIATALAVQPPPLAGWLAVLGGLPLGGAAGWHRGKLMRIRVDPATGELYQQASPAAAALLILIIFLRTGLRDMAGVSPGDHHPALLAILVTDGLMGFAVGLLILTRMEMYLRARRLLEGRGEPA